MYTHYTLDMHGGRAYLTSDMEKSACFSVTKKTAAFPVFYPLRLSRRSGDYELRRMKT